MWVQHMQSAARSSARLQVCAHLAGGEPPITFTEGGLEAMTYGLSATGCRAMGLRSTVESVSAVRDKGRERGETRNKKINGRGIAVLKVNGLQC